MRKAENFEMMDNINIYLNCDDDVRAAVEKHMDYIKSETLAQNLEFCDAELDQYDLNGHKSGIKVYKI
jgi:isoleucyl-tRNA synthetase